MSRREHSRRLSRAHRAIRPGGRADYTMRTWAGACPACGSIHGTTCRSVPIWNCSTTPGPQARTRRRATINMSSSLQPCIAPMASSAPTRWLATVKWVTPASMSMARSSAGSIAGSRATGKPFPRQPRTSDISTWAKMNGSPRSSGPPPKAGRSAFICTARAGPTVFTAMAG